MRTLAHSYHDLAAGHWRRGNLHAHTTASDGSRELQPVIDDYAQRGHDFLMISDHDIYTGQDRYAQADARGMMLIPGNEVSAHGPHLLHVGADRRVTPHTQRQRVLSDIATGPGFAVLNHPNWQQRFDHCPISRMFEWVGYAGLEIYNGTIGRLDGSPYATNKWDMLLTAGLRVWGYANDDSHLPVADVGLGWNVACCTEPGVDGVVNALRDGRFYASTGVTIDAIEVDGLRIRVAAAGAERIVALMQVGRRFAQADGGELIIDVPDKAAYVRFECWGRGEQFAWTQPFFVEQK